MCPFEINQIKLLEFKKKKIKKGMGFNEMGARVTAAAERPPGL